MVDLKNLRAGKKGDASKREALNRCLIAVCPDAIPSSEMSIWARREPLPVEVKTVHDERSG